MQRVRAIGAIVIATVGVAAAGSASGAPAPAPRTGSAVASITLPRVVVTDPTGVARDVALGSLSAAAHTDTGPTAALGLDGGAVLGTPVPGWQVDAGNGPQAGDQHVPVSTGSITGGIDLLGYDVSAGNGSATAALGALTGTLATSPVAVQADLGQHGLAATTTSASSDGDVAVTVGGVHLGLGDILPADVLAALPLSDVISLVSGLGLPVPAGATGVPAALAGLAAQLSSLDAVAGRLGTAQTALAALLAALPTTATAQQQLADAQATLAADVAALQVAQQTLGTDTAAQQGVATQLSTASANAASAQQQVNSTTAAVATLTAQVAALTTQLGNLLLTPQQVATLTGQLLGAQQQLATAQAQAAAAQSALTTAEAAVAPAQQQLDQATATVTSDQQLVTSLQQQVSGDESVVAAAQQALDALVAQLTNNPAVSQATALVAQLADTLHGLVSTITDGIAALPDLVALRSRLVDTLSTGRLLDIGALGESASATADDGAGDASVDCSVGGAAVLGQQVAAGSCADLVAAFGQLRAALAAALAQLPVAAAVAPAVDGLSASTTRTSPTSDDRTATATAALTPLHVQLPSLSLAAVADSAVGTLTGRLGTVEPALAGLGLPDVTAALTGPLSLLASSLAALPTGATLAGLRTVGVDVTLGGLAASAVHHGPAPATTGGSGGGGGTHRGHHHPSSRHHPASHHRKPVPVPTPTVPTHPVAQAAPTPALPFTGADSAVELAAAALLTAVGGHLVVLGRRPRRVCRPAG